MNDNKLTAARTALANAIARRTEAQAAVAQTASTLAKEREAFRSLVDADNVRIAQTALTLATAVNRGEKVSVPKNWNDLRSSYAEAENRIAIASTAFEAAENELVAAEAQVKACTIEE